MKIRIINIDNINGMDVIANPVLWDEAICNIHYPQNGQLVIVWEL